MSENSISQSKLKSLINYDPSTGEFVWRRKKWKLCGKTAGYINGNGYRVIMIGGRNFPAARLAWLYVYGDWPNGQVDHINHNPSDNRLSNLRDVTNQENQMNRAFTGNVSGFRGVYWDKARLKWAPSIKVNQKVINLGRYDDIVDAISVRLTAECEYGFHPNHGIELTK